VRLMGRHMRFMGWLAGLGCVALLLASCGGASTAVGQGTAALGTIAPATMNAATGGPFTITGARLQSLGGTTMQVTFTAVGGATPFAGGTSDELTVPAALTAPNTITGTLPPVCLAGDTTLAVSISALLPTGIETVPTGASLLLLGPTVTGFAPTAPPIGGPGVPVTVTGANFGPVGSTAQITFTAAAGTPFLNGTSATLVIPNATIDSTGQISGLTPNPQTHAVVAASVTVRIPCGSTATGGAGVVANFGIPGVDGTLQYQFVPHRLYNQAGTAVQTSGLDFPNTQTRDLAAIRVQLVRVSDQTVLASTASAADGTYSFDMNVAVPTVIRVLSRSHAGPVIQVVDNNNGNALWAMDSAPFTINGTRHTIDLTATTGWGGASYTGPRLAAPFSIFSTLWGATQRILASVAPQPVFPDLQVNWSPGNNQAAAFWNGSFIMLRGADGVNTDEFDTHVLVHEWGHYFETSFSRSDSPGGQHFLNGSYHPSLAWGEGWATGLAGMLLEPDSVYSDTSGPQNASGFMTDIERRLAQGAGSFGWYNEWTVWELLYDLSDANNEGPHDTLSLGIQNLFNSLANGQKNTDASVSVFSFIHSLKADNPGSAAAIDAMCAQHGLTSPVQDQWGTGETNNGGSAGNLPVFLTLTPGAPATPFTLARRPHNELQAHRLCRFQGNGAQMTLQATAPAGNANNLPQAFVYRNGVWQGVGVGPTPGGSSSGSFTSVNGAWYVVWVVHTGASVGGTYTPTIQITSP
ncbi:MAG: hypothetical protein P1V36_10515, partial [Planctomycetota bacterium]|nr:hypothetical protein [Planctomycetota bacterium]